MPHTQAPATLWLDPCEWGLPIPSVALTGAAPSQTIAISMSKGVEVPIRIEDPGQHLLRNEGRTPGAHLLVGVRTPASTFRRAIPAGPGIGGAMLKVVIPFDRPVQLAVASGFFKLADGSGEQVARPGVAIPLAVPAGQTPATVRLSVAGIR